MILSPEKPYIGVTGLNQSSQAEVVSQTFIAAGLTKPESSHRGMIGLLASQGTLSERFQGKSRYPTLEKIRQIFEVTKVTAFNTLHYHTYRRSTLASQVEELMANSGLYSDKLCEGLQLNTYWPPVEEIEGLRQRFPDLKIILQLGPRVLTWSGDDATAYPSSDYEAIVANLNPYKDLVNYVLIDPSGGRGKSFQINKIAPLANQIKDTYPDLALVLAGGFNARNVKKKLLSLYENIGIADFSIDAEEGLRKYDLTEESPTRFSESEARKYICRAALFYKSLDTKSKTSATK